MRSKKRPSAKNIKHEMDMQDQYVGDVGDYCKFVLLRAITDRDITSPAPALSLAVNWYRTNPENNKSRTQKDGKFTKYLDDLQDQDLYSKLQKLQKSRNIEAIEDSDIVEAQFYNIYVAKKQGRESWHNNALARLKDKDIVFLDPDNGLETEKKSSQKYVLRSEIEDYYTRGQSIILYQHQPRNIKKINFIKNIFQSQYKFIKIKPASIRVVEYSRYACRYFILLLHEKHCQDINKALASIENKSSKFCTVYWERPDC